MLSLIFFADTQAPANVIKAGVASVVIFKLNLKYYVRTRPELARRRRKYPEGRLSINGSPKLH